MRRPFAAAAAVTPAAAVQQHLEVGREAQNDETTRIPARFLFKSKGSWPTVLYVAPTSLPRQENTKVWPPFVAQKITFLATKHRLWAFGGV